MYRSGHLGVSLLVFAPLGYALVAAGHPTAAFVAGAAMVWLSMLPDVDNRLPLVPHRGPTHSLLFAALVGAAFAAAASVVVEAVGAAGFVADPPDGHATFAFSVGFLAVAAHLLADLLTYAGVPLFWPFGPRVDLSVTRADSGLANGALLCLGLVAVAALAVVTLGG